MEIIIIILLLIILAELTYVLLTVHKPIGRKSSRSMFIDTSVLIDGRIVNIAKSGFVSDTLMIPRSVIGELQLLADNADGEKRTRARHGLDVVTELQSMDEVNVEIFPDGSRAEEGVDERLLKLAKQHGGVLCTIDFNLNKVAQVEGITVVNVNDLAKSLRMAHLPGESIKLALTSKGNDSSQAVGHLDDGTMVVVEQAKSKIGSVVEVEVVRSLQTAAGRMMFARLIDAAPSAPAKKDNRSNGRSATVQAKATKRAANSEKPKQAKAEKPSVAKTAKPKPAPRRQKPKSTTPRRGKNNEDRLIELVNRQNAD